MSRIDVKTILKQVEELLASAGPLPADAELAVEKLLNVVETLCSDQTELTDEIDRWRKRLEKKKKAKTTAAAMGESDQPSQDDSDHSSDKRRPSCHSSIAAT